MSGYVSFNSLFNSNYIDNYGYEYPQYVSTYKTDAQSAGEELSSYFSRLKSPHNPAGNNPYIFFGNHTSSIDGTEDIIPETTEQDNSIYNIPGTFELDDYVENYKQIIVNDNKGREAERTVNNTDGDFVYKSVSKYHENGKDVTEEKLIYDENGNTTGSIIYYTSFEGSVSKAKRIEYRDSIGNILCVFDAATGRWLDKSGYELKIEEVNIITKQIYPNTKLMAEYSEEIQKIAPLIDIKVNEIVLSNIVMPEENPEIQTENDIPDMDNQDNQTKENTT